MLLPQFKQTFLTNEPEKQTTKPPSISVNLKLNESDASHHMKGPINNIFKEKHKESADLEWINTIHSQISI